MLNGKVKKNNNKWIYREVGKKKQLISCFELALLYTWGPFLWDSGFQSGAGGLQKIGENIRKKCWNIIESLLLNIFYNDSLYIMTGCLSNTFIPLHVWRDCLAPFIKLIFSSSLSGQGKMDGFVTLTLQESTDSPSVEHTPVLCVGPWCGKLWELLLKDTQKRLQQHHSPLYDTHSPQTHEPKFCKFRPRSSGQ